MGADNVLEISIIKYTKENKTIWDEFCKAAKNRHFFFQRDYMEYHKDRFIDGSLMFFEEKKGLIACLPASQNGTSYVSHGGLTFGGFVVDNNMTTSLMLECFAVLNNYLAAHGFKEFIYKCMPYIYHRYPADEDLYALFRNKAELIRRDVSTSIYLPTRYKYYKGRKWMVNKGKKSGFVIKNSFDFDGFIALENDVLQRYHDASAVHSASELLLLAERFPDNIRLYTAELNGALMAGTVIFDNGQVVHTQYMANSEAGREIGALDAVIDYLISNVYADRMYFDFGISNEDDGYYLNEGLIRQKEGFGARAVVHDYYRIVLGG